MAELRNGGMSRSALASSASTMPSASESATSVASSGAMRARTRSSASSTESDRAAARAALGLVGIVRSLVSGAPALVRQQVLAGRLEGRDHGLALDESELARGLTRDVSDEREAAVERETDAPADRLDARDA